MNNKLKTINNEYVSTRLISKIYCLWRPMSTDARTQPAIFTSKQPSS